MKISSKNELLKFLKSHGFRHEGGTKHEKWTDGKTILPLPKDKKGFSRMMAERLIKQAGLWDIYHVKSSRQN